MNYSLMPLKYFVDVVQTGEFVSAAKRNFVSETAVSSAVKKLESELGQRLLNRNDSHHLLTPVGEQFYQRAVAIINSYNEIWYHPDSHPEKLVRIHFLQGLGGEAADFAKRLPQNTYYAFDEELLDQSIARLVKGYYDILIGFQLAFRSNSKLKIFPFKTISFDLLFNKKEISTYEHDLKKLAKKSQLYLQNWQSTGIFDVQTAMLETYSQNGWNYERSIYVNSFSSACLNVNFKGGFAMVPETFKIPEYCEDIYRITPKHLKNAFKIVIATNTAVSENLLAAIKRATS